MVDEPNTGQASSTSSTDPHRLQIRVAKIGLYGALGAAVITGIFSIVQSVIGPEKSPDKKPSPPPQSSDAPPDRTATPIKTKQPKDPKPVDYKGIDIPDGYNIDFADEPPQPSEGYPSRNGDFGYIHEFLETHYSNRLVLLKSGQSGSLDTCRNETRYTQEVSRDNVIKGSQICITTEAGHIGLVTVRGFSPDDSESVFTTVDLTVWRNAVEPEDEQ